MKLQLRWILGLAVLAALNGAASCDDKDDDDGAPAAGVTYRQVERLGRPAINEGLFVTNDFLNAVNSITPAQEPSALTGGILAEAAASLDAFDSLDGAESITPGQVVGAFIPDVLRIDTAGASGYGNALNASGSPVRGRRITDDVVDITLTYLVTGAPGTAVSDGVSYEGAGTSSQPGHQPVLSTFPYLPAPN